MKADRAGRLIVRGVTSSGLGLAVRFGARFLFLLAAGRLYGATLFGAYSIAIALVEAAVIAGGLSTKWVLFKWLNESDGRRPVHIVFDAALLVLGASGLIALLIVGAVLAVPRPVMAGNVEAAIVSLALAIPLQALIELLLGATRWTERMRFEVVAKNGVQPYVTILVAIAAYWAGLREEGLFLSYLAGTVASLAYTLHGLRTCFGRFDLLRYRPRAHGLRAMLKATIPTTGAELIDALYTRLDIYVVGILLSAHSAGIYGMARQVSMPVRQIRQAFDTMLVPIVARTVSHAGPEGTGPPLASAARLILLVQLPAFVGLVAIGRPLLHLIGRDFAYGMGAVLCLAAAETIQGAFGVSELLLIYSRPRAAVALTAAFMAIGVAAAVLLEPVLGLTGVALAVALSYSGRAMARRLLIGRIYDLRVPGAYWIGPALAAAAGLAAALALSFPHSAGHNLVAAIPSLAGGLCAYALVLLVWLRATGETLVPRGFVARMPA